MKTDIRKSKSVNKIKESFITVHAREGYNGVTVSAVCKDAGISRGTFYAHYGNVSDVLNEVLDDALDGTGKFWGKILNVGHDGLKDKCAIPFCIFVRENKKYQKLLTDDAFFSIIVEKMVDRSFERYYERMFKYSECSGDQMRSLMTFQISGCLSIIKKSLRENAKEWNCVRECIDKFVKGGIESVVFADDKQTGK